MACASSSTWPTEPPTRTLAAFDIELIAPHRGNRVNLSQDGRPLRRYKRRWKIEPLFAWLQNSRRLVTRYERRAANFACFSRTRDFTRVFGHSRRRSD